jgi:hypothetical protein
VGPDAVRPATITINKPSIGEPTMYKLFAVALAGVAGAAIWRRKELRSDAERASKATLGAARSARSRLGTATDDEATDATGPGEPADNAGHIDADATTANGGEHAAESMT